MTTNAEITPFKDGLEHLVAEMQLVRLKLGDKAKFMAKRFESEMESSFRGYGITPTEAIHQINDTGNPSQADTIPPEILHAHRLRLERSLEEGIYLPLVALQKLFLLNRLESDIIVISLLPEFYPGLGKVFGFLQDNATLSYPTVGLITDLYCKEHRERKFVRQTYHSGSPLMRWELIVPVGDVFQTPLLKREYRVDERIVSYLMGSDRPDGGLEGVGVVNDVVSVSRPDTAVEVIVKGVKQRSGCHLVSLCGDNRDGAVDFIETVSGSLGWKVLKAPLSVLYRKKEWNLRVVNQLLREAILQPASIFLYEDQGVSDEQLPDMTPLLRSFALKGKLIFYQGNKTFFIDCIEPAINYTKLEFNFSNASERAVFWKEAIKKNKLDWSDHVAKQLAMKYPASERQINMAFDRLIPRLNGNGKDTASSLKLLMRVINDYTQQPLDELAQRIETVFDWSDLVLHKSVIRHLKAFKNTIAHQFKVYEEWGLGAKMSRGRGTVALFSGLSGTGKTMAAEVISHDLGINLYRIDLAGLVSKYIGETEKNLKRIFESAKGSNVLLFFDEADALFGKRTQIHDSHDRYANLEVSYLLQRLEEHDGPVVLATNLRKNMDEAFLRRIHFVIEFPKPSESLRQVIWQKYLPPSVPRAEEIDTLFLSKHFEISPGDIKNAAVQAAFAAAANGSGLTMQDLVVALKREYQKLGKLFPGSLVGHISNSLPESPKIRRRRKEVKKLGY